MKKFTNPLDNIRVASPCRADWNEMIGDNRKRFCGECKLNVYNLSGMTCREAENLILNAEGNLCVRFYRRADGSVLTKDCPVGWRAIKQRVSKMAAAFVSLIFGILSGLGLNGFYNRESKATVGEMTSISNTAMGGFSDKPEGFPMMGNISVQENKGEYKIRK